MGRFRGPQVSVALDQLAARDAVAVGGAQAEFPGKTGDSLQCTPWLRHGNKGQIPVRWLLIKQ
jgi:hypothetical protein